MIDFKLGARPLRPTDPSQNRWLQDRVWNVITTCWDHDPGRRCELSVVCQVFSTPSIVVESVRPDGREGYLTDGLLFRKNKMGGPQLVPDMSRREAIIRYAHDQLGHKGIFATTRTLLIRFSAWTRELPGYAERSSR